MGNIDLIPAQKMPEATGKPRLGTTNTAAHALHREAATGVAHTAQQRAAPLTENREPVHNNEDPHSSAKSSPCSRRPQRACVQQWRPSTEKNLINLNGVRKTRQPDTKEWNSTTILHQTPKWTQHGFKTWSQKTPRRKHRQSGTSPGDDFWIWHQSKSNKSKNKQMRLHYTKNLLYSKGNHQQNEKATYWMRENICQPCTW